MSDYYHIAAFARINELTDALALRDAEVAKLSKDLHFQACLTRDFMPYQERAVLAEQQVTLLLDALMTAVAKNNNSGLATISVVIVEEALAATEPKA